MAEDKDKGDDGILHTVEDMVDQILPAEPGYEAIKEEVWMDLADIYYKYESDSDQKRAFREVMYEISDKIQVGKWDTVYHKLYRIEQEEKEI
ncbi:hypothetical protein GF326_04290 [Candidatus Bathyarchaeota archaeon]|nr:hypothetical protein [Candidatus Bathyarchaeota archaeon]